MTVPEFNELDATLAGIRAMQQAKREAKRQRRWQTVRRWVWQVITLTGYALVVLVLVAAIVGVIR